MIVSQLQFAAMRRVDVPEAERRDFFLYADEFQNFATESFATVLSEARKYRLDLTLTHQYIEQMPEAVQAAVFGNVGTLICFTVGPTDSEFLEKEFEPVFTANDLITLGRYEMYLKLQIDDTQSQPFSARSLPPTANPTNTHDRAVAASREKYGRQVENVEKIIKKWSETRFRPGQPPQPPAWSIREGQKVQETPVEGEQAPKEEIVQSHHVYQRDVPEQVPKPFVRENIPGLADLPTSQEQTEVKDDSEVEILNFPQVRQERQVTRPFSEDPEKKISFGQNTSGDNLPE
ncbi:MAG: hypothetical protein A2Z24_03045 [Candidatus Woykebacteria bacterium RBG_16_44_10]|uniref:TraD/TraG TraM recognition site domain-containing protein n=1 Tax=Candidatus Woykebacteria bacterium RBG_16_44_10 TaxID=1802597 RepID=A0A1G1WG28_9BACT|nr:MAG: hypothetical protein A2Z24_03045 [Candidatus Woykebacteria bacterium RBG_16_44_10]